MSRTLEQLLKNAENAAELSELIDLAGVSGDSLFSGLLFQVALSDSKRAPRAQAMLRKALTGRALVNQMTPATQHWPQIRQDKMILVGKHPATGQIVSLDFDHLTLKLIIVAASGAGKTTLAALLIGQLVNRLTIFFSDSKREGYRVGRLLGVPFLYAKPNRIYTNDLEPAGSDPELYFTGLMEDCAYLLAIDRRTAPVLAGVLFDVFRQERNGSPMISIAQFVRLLDHIATKEGKPTYATAAAKFRILEKAYGKRARVRRAPDLFARYPFLATDFSGSSHQVRAAFQAMMFRRLMQSISASGHDPSPKFLIVRDEGLDDSSVHVSQRDGQVTYQDQLESQARSFGICQMTLYQEPGQIPASAIANTANLIVLRLPHYDHARKVVKLLGLTDDHIPIIQSLPPGHGYLRSPHFTQAVPFVSPFVDLGRYPDDAEISAAMDAEYRWMERHSEFSPEEKVARSTRDYADILGMDADSTANGGTDPAREQSPPPPPSSPPGGPGLLDDWRILLRDIDRNPDASIVDHYAAVGFSRSKGTRVTKELKAHGLVTATTFKRGQGRPRTILKLTDLGRQTLKGAKQP